MLTQEEKQIVEYAKTNGKTQQQTEVALAKYRTILQKQAPQPEESRGVIADIPSDLMEGVKGIGETIKRRGEKQREILQADASGQQGKLSSIFQTATNLASTVTEVIGQAVLTAGKLFTSQGTEESIKGKVGEVAQKVMSQPEVQQFIQNYKDLEKSNPEMARNLVATVEGGAFLLEFLGLKGATVGAEATIRGGKAVSESAIQTGKQVASTAVRTGEQVAGAIEKPIQATLDIAGMAGEKVAQLPGRLATNIADVKATGQAIKELSTEVAQNAVKQGVDIADVRTLGSIALNSTEKSTAKKLVESVKRFASGFRDADPSAVVGEPIVNSLKELESMKSTVGKKIGEVAQTLGKTTKEELEPAILARLRQVKGLEGLKQTASGALNFDNTLLRTIENKSTREAIRKLFNQAITSESGAKKNLLRQELFEILGGKRKSLANITDTGEKAYEAIRKGLADVLDTKNADYKAFNQQFAQLNQPIDDLRKLLRAADPTISSDLLSESAGSLARRLTSNAISKGEISRVLSAIDEILKASGKETVSVKKMQDLYNVLNAYYDIAPKAGFQGGIKQGVESAIGSPLNAVTGLLKNSVGETQAVRQKALEDLLTEILK